MVPSNSLSPDQVVNFRQDLFRDLRMELVQLKSCQSQIIIIALAGTGVMLGLAKDQTNPPNCLPVFFLLPLMILLPLWIIFFDKARTISRIIGFILTQEKLILKKSDLGVIGWESAMEEYRKQKLSLDDKYRERRSNQKTPDLQNKNKPLSESVYWVIVYCVFLLLSLSCLLLSIAAFKNQFFKEYLHDNIFIMGCLLFASTLICSLFLALREDGTRRFQKIKIWSIGSGILLIITIIFGSILLIHPDIFTFEFLYWCILVIFWIAFVICAGVTLWYFKNLVKGRYSYREFEWRWKTILDIPEDF